MRKIVIISSLIILLSGCSVFRKVERRSSGKIMGGKEMLTPEMLQQQNLSGTGFFIPKAEVEVSMNGFKERFLAVIKYSAPGSYLFSLRSRSGIEAARIFVSRDTLLINDRFNRKLYHGDPEYLGLKYGLPYEILPVIFGDYIPGSQDNAMGCIDGTMHIESFLKGLKMIYAADCRKGKLVKATQEGSLDNILNEIQYDDFDEAGDIIFPSLIKINNEKTGAEITIHLGKVEKPWNGAVEFIPGNRYELIELR